MAVLGNVRTHLSLRKLKPNNKEKNYAIYGTALLILKNVDHKSMTTAQNL